jgi:hypothetical protein
MPRDGAIADAGSGSDAARTVFTLRQIHARPDARPNSARITALAIDSQLHRLFLGLSNGRVQQA